MKFFWVERGSKANCEDELSFGLGFDSNNMVIAFTPESSTFIAMEEIEFTIENLNKFVTDITGESGFEWAVEEQPEGGIQLVDYAAESSH